MLYSVVFAPVAIILSFVLGEVWGYPAGMYWLSIPCLVLAGAGIVSLFFTMNENRALPKIVWWIAALIALVNAGYDIDTFFNPPVKAEVADTVSYSNDYYGYNYSFTGNYSSASSGSSGSRTCTACTGSGKCHVCKGIRKACQSMYCNGGRCTSCKGTGIYVSGKLASDCLVCHGDGLCDTCKGLDVHVCSLCNNDRICDYCGGDGKK